MKFKPVFLSLLLLTLACTNAVGQSLLSTVGSDIEFAPFIHVDEKNQSISAFDSATDDEKLMMAQLAFHQQELGRLSALETRLNGHTLESYVQNWSLITQANLGFLNADLKAKRDAFLKDHKGEYIEERFRTDWLTSVASNLYEENRWNEFQNQRNKLVWNADEPIFRCWDIYHRLEKANKKTLPAIVAESQRLLKNAQIGDLAVCQKAAQTMIRRSPSSAFAYLLTLIEQNRINRANTVLDALAKQRGFPIKEAKLALNQTTKWYNRYGKKINKRDKRVALIGLYRLSRTNIKAAAKVGQALQPRLTSSERASVWGRIGYVAALDHLPETLSWYAKGGQNVCNGIYSINPNRCVEWRARTALREQRWKTLDQLIQSMPKSLSIQPNWIYWRGRALAESGQKQKAIKLWKQIPDVRSFYGKLAAEELGKSILYQPSAEPKINLDALKLLDHNVGLQRARAFYDLGMNNFGHREWNWQLRGKDAHALLTMAHWAKEKNLLHRMINTAERIRSLPIANNLLYPRPYLPLIESFSERANISKDWVYGLIRQESRFIVTARSTVGANGLMQIMPTTAQWVANKIEMQHFDANQIYDVETNLHLGTAYLRLLLDRLDENIVLATAGYNAGPHRSFTWRASLTKPVEGAIFVETIPFTETRTYVQNVLANTIEYSQLSGKAIPSLKKILGTIEPKPVTSKDTI